MWHPINVSTIPTEIAFPVQSIPVWFPAAKTLFPSLKTWNEITFLLLIWRHLSFVIPTYFSKLSWNPKKKSLSLEPRAMSQRTKIYSDKKIDNSIKTFLSPLLNSSYDATLIYKSHSLSSRPHSSLYLSCSLSLSSEKQSKKNLLIVARWYSLALLPHSLPLPPLHQTEPNVPRTYIMLSSFCWDFHMLCWWEIMRREKRR